MTYKIGHQVQYFSSSKKWEFATYCGTRPDGRHVCETPGKQVKTLTDAYIREVPKEVTLSGHVVVFRQMSGDLTLIGPHETEGAAMQAAKDYKSIFANGPLAVIDLSRYGIHFTEGDGLLPAAPQSVTHSQSSNKEGSHGLYS